MAYRRGHRILTFTPSFLPFTILYLCLAPIVRLVAWWLFGVTVKGRENLRAVGRAILVSNHTLVLDPALVATAIWPRRAYFTMLEETAQIPLLGTFVRLLGGIPLTRGPRAIVRQERGIAEAIRHLGLVHFFPEGECFIRNQQLMPFHRGAFLAACRHRLPVIPVTVVLKERVWKLWRLLDLPPRALVLVGAPLDPMPCTRTGVEALAVRARAIMQSAIDLEGGCKTIGRGAMPRLALHRAAERGSPIGAGAPD